jgi:hypothetical protein
MKEIKNDDNFPSEIPVQNTIGKLGLMWPTKYALTHDATPLLNTYSKDGCPVNCGPDWDIEQIKLLLKRGPHKSSTSKEAIRQLRKETEGKISNGYARVVRWGDIKNNIPKNLKISPVAMIPHKSRKFRCILDLSFKLQHKGKIYSSVNEETTKLAKPEAMVQLGLSLKRIIHCMAKNSTKPFKFAKLDIKDGFWRMAVSNENAWNFCYVLPTLRKLESDDDIELVVPNSLQMGWCESPPFFCSGSETARDVIQSLLKEEKVPEHRMEMQMIQEITEVELKLSNTTTVVEVFVDDFIAATNNIGRKELQHISRCMLHGVHSVFPPPELTKHIGGDPVSQKKLDQGEGTWLFKKEILGWDFDGKLFTIQLPIKKCQDIRRLLKNFIKSKKKSLNKFQRLSGKLQHASFGIPGGVSLFTPIQMAMAGNPPFIIITDSLKSILSDWRYIIHYMEKHPTSVHQLVRDYPNFVGYSDACALGAGGAWTSGTSRLHPFMWQVEWPSDIREAVCSAHNPTGHITINDLELAGAVLNWLALEAQNLEIKNKHVALFCDNTPTVSWATAFRTSKSSIAGRLLRVLGMRIHASAASSLTTMYIKGQDNIMADTVSRAFKSGKYFSAQQNLTHYFNSQFQLPQGRSWTECQLPTAWTSRIIACLRGKQLPLESLLRLPKTDNGTGSTGVPLHPSANATHSSKTCHPSNETSSSQLLLHGSGQECTEKEFKLRYKGSLMRSQPSARPSNWLDNKVQSTGRTMFTPSQSKGL